MTYPFVIWTTQRTGSTTLANLLAALSQKTIMHEPFNKSRPLQYQNDKETLLKNLQSLSESKLYFKHCWNVHPSWTNQLIFQHIIQDNYKIILLYRSNALKMHISKELAKQTGVWGLKQKLMLSVEDELQPFDITKLKEQIKIYQSQLKTYKSQLKTKNCDFLELSYEKLFEEDVSYETRKEIISEICQFLDIDRQNIVNKEENVYEQLMNKKQNTVEEYQKIPNLKEIEQEFSTNLV